MCVFTGALEAVISLYTTGDVFFYGSYDGAIRSFNLKNGKRAQVLRGHSDWVNHIYPSQKDPKVIYSCSRDKTIREWNIESGQLMHIFEGHLGPVNFLDIQDNKMVSASHDGSVLIWNLDTKEIEKSFTGHTSIVSSVKLYGSLLVSGSYDTFVKIVDTMTNRVVNIFAPSQSPIKCIDIYPPILSGSVDSNGNQSINASTPNLESLLVITGCADGNIYINHLLTGKLIKILKGHTDAVLCLKMFRDNVLFSGSDDKQFFQWDFEKGTVTHAYLGHNDSVRCISINNDEIFTGSFDCSVRSWDFETVQRKIEQEKLIQQELEEQRKKQEELQAQLKKEKSKGKAKGKLKKK